MKNRKVLGSVLLLITAFVWGVAFVFQRTGMDHITPVTFMACRCVLAVICLGILLVFMKGPAKAFVFSPQTIKGGILCGICMTFANNFQQIGMVSTTAGKAAFITTLYIVLVPVINMLFFKENPAVNTIVGIVLGAVGLFLLCMQEDFSVMPGDVWVIACAVLFSMHIITTSRFVGKADPVQMSFIQFVVCSVLGWIAAFIFEEPAWGGIWEARISIAYCGIISAGVGYTLQIVAQQYTEPATASLLMSFESVFAALSGAVILSETMTTRETLGCVIMFVAVLIVESRELNWFGRKNKG